MLTILLLVVSNTFMTFAWYGHLRYRSAPIVAAVLVSWLIALGESFRWNYLASYVCLFAAVLFAFWGRA